MNMKMVGVGVTHLACLRVGQENTHLPLDDSKMKDSQLPLAADYGVRQVEQGKCIEKTVSRHTYTNTPGFTSDTDVPANRRVRV